MCFCKVVKSHAISQEVIHEGKDLGLTFLLGIVLGVLEGLQCNGHIHLKASRERIENNYCIIPFITNCDDEVIIVVIVT